MATKERMSAMPEPKEKVKRSISEGFEWLRYQCNAVTGEALARCETTEALKVIQAISDEIKSVISPMEALTQQLQTVLEEILDLQDQIDFETTKKIVFDGLRNNLSSMMKVYAKTADLRQQNLYEKLDVRAIKKVSLRRMLQDLIVEEIREGKR